MAIELLPESPNGEITHLNVREKVNECATSLNTPLKRNRFVFLENYSNQTPVAQDTLLQVSFGGTSTNGKVDVDASGTSTFAVDGTFDFLVTVQNARSSSGGTSWNYLQIYVNGSPALGSALTKLSDANSDHPEQFEFSVTGEAGDTVQVFFWVGSEGASDGFLEAVTPAINTGAPGSANDTPSARLAISQYEAVT